MSSNVLPTTLLLRGLRWSYQKYGLKGAVAFVLGVGAVAYLWRRAQTKKHGATRA